MSALTIDRHRLPIIDRTAIRLGTTLVMWGKRRARSRRESIAADQYRADYVEHVRSAAAVVRQSLLP